MKREITLEESESILSNFDAYSESEFRDLARALKELSNISIADFAEDIPDINSIAPNVLPINSKTRNLTIVTIAGALVATAAIGAAALTGYAPQPIVNFAKSAVQTITRVIATVIAEDDEGGPITKPTSLQLASSEPENIVAQPQQSPANEAVAVQESATPQTKPVEPTHSPVALPDPRPTPVAPAPIPTIPTISNESNEGKESKETARAPEAKSSSESHATEIKSIESKSGEVKTQSTAKTSSTTESKKSESTSTKKSASESSKKTSESSKSSSDG